jgi:transcriptional regulator with XRE-family HTH domain
MGCSLSKVIGKFIKVRRTELGLSQNDLARSLGYNTSQYISNIERGLASIPFAKIQEMSSLLKVDYRHLLNLKLMEEVPGFKEEFLGTRPAAMEGNEAGLVSIPVMTPQLCANWTDLRDLDFPRKISNRFEYARTDDAQAFFFEAQVNDLNLMGIRNGDLLLVEPSRRVDRHSIVLSVRFGKFRLIKILPRNGEVILQPLEESGELEIVRRQDVQVFAVSELKRSLSHH